MSKFNHYVAHVKTANGACDIDSNNHRAIADYLHQGLKTLAQWRNNSAVRKELQRLPKAILQDIGLTEFDVYQEAQRWFWEPVDYQRLAQKRRANGRTIQ